MILQVGLQNCDSMSNSTAFLQSLVNIQLQEMFGMQMLKHLTENI